MLPALYTFKYHYFSFFLHLFIHSFLRSCPIGSQQFVWIISYSSGNICLLLHEYHMIKQRPRGVLVFRGDCSLDGILNSHLLFLSLLLQVTKTVLFDVKYKLNLHKYPSYIFWENSTNCHE